MTFSIVAALLLSQPPEMVGPPLPAPIIQRRSRRDPRCDLPPEQREEGEEIVVCGETYDENSPYRVPQEFRGLRSDDDRDASHAARTWDNDTLLRNEDQVSGPSAFLRRSQQQECEWRAARQEAQGRRPDCRARSRPDQPTDWQRERR